MVSLTFPAARPLRGRPLDDAAFAARTGQRDDVGDGLRTWLFGSATGAAEQPGPPPVGAGPHRDRLPGRRAGPEAAPGLADALVGRTEDAEQPGAGLHAHAFRRRAGDDRVGTERVDWARTSIRTVRGTAGAARARKGAAFRTDVQAPAGAVAEVHVPTAGRDEVSAPDGARHPRTESGSAVRRVTRGTWRLTSVRRAAAGREDGQPATTA
ncbi:alpha-L-rhamnosidase C-terminal domain-containing protein [Streptomyces glaucus]|uniref:alpha-L-rhamnosidase C-terminal domain-containing protein n=1 Tax=Streptomyces glaucus TaxID=284029 RepID=UPI0031D00FA6